MVYIINGEIVADTDPRARPSASRPAGSSVTSNRFADLSRPAGASSANTSATAAAGSASDGGVPHVVLSVPDTLGKVESMLGITGKKVKIPSFFGRASVDLPLLYLLIVGIVLYMGGVRAVLPILALGYFVASSAPRRN